MDKDTGELFDILHNYRKKDLVAYSSGCVLYRY